MNLFRQPVTIEEAVSEHVEPLRAFLQAHINLHDAEGLKHEMASKSHRDMAAVARQEVSKAEILLSDLDNMTAKKKRAA